MKRVFAHIGFSVATTLFVLCFVNPDSVILFALGLTVLLTVSLMLKKYRQAVTIPLCLSSALFACLLFLCVYRGTVEPALMLNGQKGFFSFYIINLPEFDGDKYVYTVKTTEVLINGAPRVLKLRLFTESPVLSSPFTVIKAYGKFKMISDSAFSSYGYWSDGIYLTVKASDFVVTDKTVFSPLSLILSVRNDIIETFMSSVKGNEGALSAALVTGDKYYLNDEIKQAFRVAGCSHIIAVSGLHISVVTGGIYYILKHISVNRKLTSAVIVFITLMYMALADFSGSVVRAGIMMILFFADEFFNKKADSLNSLGFAVFILCLNPFSVSDAGAVLSVLSVLSLIVYYPYLNNVILGDFNEKINTHKHGILKILESGVLRIFKCIVFSICILTFNLPAIYLFFDYTSLMSIFSNFIILPLGSFATVLSFVTYISCKINMLSGIFVIICKSLNTIIIGLVNSFSSVSFLNIPFSQYYGVILASLLIVSAVAFIVFKGKQIKALLVFIYLVLIIALAINLYSQYNNPELINSLNKGVVYAVNN